MLIRYLPEIRQSCRDGAVLDLACGKGRNGLYLARHNIPVVFADIERSALDIVRQKLAALGRSDATWEVDFEVAENSPLDGKKFDAVIVFNYLHRPLIPKIRTSLSEGGILLYETFTVEQAKVGRPKNPDYLLQPGELRSWFDDWEILDYREGEESEPRRFFASLAARKPGRLNAE